MVRNDLNEIVGSGEEIAASNPGVACSDGNLKDRDVLVRDEANSNIKFGTGMGFDFRQSRELVVDLFY